MTFRLKLIKSGFAALALFSLAACGDGSSGEDKGATNGQPGNNLPTSDLSNDESTAISLSNIEVPAESISSADSTATVQAINAGIDPEKILFDTGFSCYEHASIDFSTPDATFTVTGQTFTGNLGSGTIDYNPSFADFFLTGLPFFDNNTSLKFDDYGQRFTVEGPDDKEFSCFQIGASEERALHQFLLKTPEAGEYTCTSADATAQQSLRLSDSGQYESTLGSGSYTFRDIIRDGQPTKIDFTSGPLDGVSARYRENAQNGQQNFQVTDTELFGFAMGSTTSSTYDCRKSRTPRPFKQYGSMAATPVPAPSASLSGLYYTPNIFFGGLSGGGQEAVYYHFRPDGYLSLYPPSAVGDDCDRTLPNGLNYCRNYNVENGRLKIYNNKGEEEDDKQIRITDDGAPAEIDDEAVEAVKPMSDTQLSGIWGNSSFFSLGCFGEASSCLDSLSKRYYRFESDGRFIQILSSDSSISSASDIASTTAFSSSSSDSTGNYEIRGNRLLLSFDDGSTQNMFIFMSEEEILAIDDLLFTLENEQ